MIIILFKEAILFILEVFTKLIIVLLFTLHENYSLQINFCLDLRTITNIILHHIFYLSNYLYFKFNFLAEHFNLFLHCSIFLHC